MDTTPTTSHHREPRITNPDGSRQSIPVYEPGTTVRGRDGGVGAQVPKTLLQWERASSRWTGRPRVGIEFDGRSLVLVGVHHTRKKDVIQRLHVVEWDAPPSVDDLVTCLRGWVPRVKLNAAVVISAPRAMVRYFHLPPVKKRHREKAARWEGQKLLPFALKEETALVGLDFERDGNNGWWTTLVAIPREDGDPILEAIGRLGWTLDSVSLRGTHSLPQSAIEGSADHQQAKAVVLFSRGRGSFAVFRDGMLRFHYDLGMIPEPPSFQDTDNPRWAETSCRAWVEILGSLIADPFEFCLGVGPDEAPRRLELIGFPEQILPLVTDWSARFPSGVTVTDPLRAVKECLPAETAACLDHYPGMIVSAFLAATNPQVVDCTPLAMRDRRRLEYHSRIARGVLITSFAIAATWVAFSWVSLNYIRQSVARTSQEQQMYQKSLAAADVHAKIAELAASRQRLAQTQHPSRRWMPWVKTVLGTLPDNAGLSILEMQRQDASAGESEDVVSVRLIGTLSPDGPPHPLTYRHWIGQLANLTSVQDEPRLQERSVVWKGRTRSTFSIEMRPALSTVTGGSR